MDFTDLFDLFRLAVGGLGLLVALFAVRIAWRAWPHERPRSLGLLSFASFALIATIDQWQRYHEYPPSWRLPAFTFALALSLFYVRASMQIDWRPPHRRA